VEAPRKLLAFRTFAYIRVGILLGRLLVDSDIARDNDGSWVEQLAAEHHEAIVREVVAVAEEIGADPAYAEDQLGPNDEERQRFSDFAKKHLA
jgi:hypothetical protein